MSIHDEVNTIGSDQTVTFIIPGLIWESDVLVILVCGMHILPKKNFAF